MYTPSGPDIEDTMGVYAFPCGAEIRAYAPTFKLSKNNRVRLVVLGGDKNQRPVNEGVVAPCMTACPRRQFRRIRDGWLEQSDGTERKTALVTCLGTWRFEDAAASASDRNDGEG